MIKIAIFDDHQHRRDALKLLVGLENEMKCVGDYENCENIVENFSARPADVILMDIDMPKVTGIDGVKLIKKNFPDTCIIMQTVFEDDEKIFNSILAGADGYILKKTPPEKLIEGIYDVMNGGAAMTATVAGRVLELFKKQNFQPEERFDLSERELEILSLLVKGLSHKMIAAELKISIYTVNNHIKNIYQKLHVHSVSEAVSTALQKKIV